MEIITPVSNPLKIGLSVFWRSGGVAEWRSGGLAGWRAGGLAWCVV
jgi:hypothetical protein